MPELPEVQALAQFLRERLVGQVVAGVDVASIQALKTFDPPPSSLGGLTVADVARRGKMLDVDVDGLHLVVHLSRGGWVRYSAPTASPPAPARPGKGPLALRVRFADRAKVDVTEQGTQKRLAVWLVRDPQEVPAVAKLGPDPLAPEFGPAALDAVLAAAGAAQLKGVLRDQQRLAGIGNAYSDEILHAAKLSPFRAANSLDDAERARLASALHVTLSEATDRAAGRGAAELKDAKRSGLRVHGQAGAPCPVCGDVIRSVSFADSSLEYCPTCQTGGVPLADRRLSRLLR